jgi:serine/threonine-protein kinase
MPAGRVAELGRQLADALEAAHAASVVHGDVKPENVLVGVAEPLTVKLGDFGIARIVDATASKTSSQVGTPRYMAPERVTGDPVGPASDIYSLGALLYEALAGRPVFTAETPVALWRAHVETEPPRPDGISDSWWTLLERMLAKPPGHRPAATQVAASLAAGATEPDVERIEPLEEISEPTLSPATTTIIKKNSAAPTDAPAPGPRRRGVGQSAAAAVALLVAAGLVWAVMGRLPAGARDDAASVTPGTSASTSASAATAPSTVPPSTGTTATSPTTAPPTATGPTTATGPNPQREATTAPPPAATTVKPAAPKTVNTTPQCQAASHTGGLDIGPALNNSGGPNFVPNPCTAIWLRLTEVYYITYAKACIEDGNGNDIRCGGWVFLEDKGAWNRLLDGVSPGDRWQLYLKAQGQGHVAFLFSG